MNLLSSVNGTSVTLEWAPPLDKGGRHDVLYNVICRRCAWDSGQCETCGAGIRFVPQQMNLVQGSLAVTNLLAHTNYTFWVEALNGVSDLSLEPLRFAAVNITTNQAGRRWPPGTSASLAPLDQDRSLLVCTLGDCLLSVFRVSCQSCGSLGFFSIPRVSRYLQA